MAKARSQTGLHLDPLYLRHDTGPEHPESPLRYQALMECFEREGIVAATTPLPLREAKEKEIYLAHDSHYVELVRAEVAQGVDILRTGDTPLCEESFEIAKWAVGGVLEAVDWICKGKIENAFCAVRPPGHHANAFRGMGFCIFNNVAVAARYAQKKHHLKRILIVDWDVHHGNGTQDIFYEDPTVFYFSTHQLWHYPGTGAIYERGLMEGAGKTLNCPYPPGAGMKEIRSAFVNHLYPAIEDYAPDLIIISAGFDARRNDPLGDFLLEDEDFAELTHLLKEWARGFGHTRVLSVLEGGYAPEGLCSAALAHVRALLS